MKAFRISIIVIIIIFILVCSVWTIYTQINEHYSQNDPKLMEMKKKFEEFFKREKFWEKPFDMLNGRDIMSEINLYRGNKSFTINKEKIYICLKNDNGNYYDDNMLVYVIAHEISHVICPEIGHTELFHDIFEKLLVKLVDAGIYNPSLPIQTDYCQDGDPEII